MPAPEPAGETEVPLVHLTTMNRAWLISPAASSAGRITPAARPKCAAVAFEPRPSASAVPIAVRPPQLIEIVPPPAGLDATCQKSYSQPEAWSITAMWPSRPRPAWPASGIRTCMPSISQVPQCSMQSTV